MNDPPKQLMQFTHTLERQEPQFRAALPRGMDPLRYIRMLRTAVNSRPELLWAATGTQREQNSFWVAVMRAAASGLAPDGREGLINVYNVNLAKKGETPIWSRQCQWQTMIYGIYKLLRQNPAIHSVYAHVVRAADEFEYLLGDDAKIVHRPSLEHMDSSVIAAYAIVKLANGEAEREVMSVKQIESVRAKSQAPDSMMWTDFYDQACCKTVMRRLAKRLPAIDDIFEEEDENQKPMRALADEPVYPPIEPGPDHPEDVAYYKGRNDRLKDVAKGDVPEEYRGEGKTNLAARWLEGWTAAGKDKKGKGE